MVMPASASFCEFMVQLLRGVLAAVCMNSLFRVISTDQHQLWVMSYQLAMNCFDGEVVSGIRRESGPSAFLIYNAEGCRDALVGY